jgi:uncharacterized protein
MLFYGKEVVMTKQKALIEIRLAGLPQGVNSFDFTCTADDFHDPALIEAGFSGKIVVTVIVEKLDAELIITMKTASSANLACDLCLTPVSVELTGSYRVYYGYEFAGERDESENEEYRLIDRNTLSIDLSEDVRETLMLSVPMKITCMENPDCMVFRQEKADETGENPGTVSDWQESLEKLKNKYR